MTESNQINNIIRNLNLEIKEFQHKLTTLPAGDLLCEKNGKYIKWYKKNPKNSNYPKYIPKKNRTYAEALAARKYYTQQIIIKKQKMDLLNKYLLKEKKIRINPNQLLDESSLYKELLISHFQSYSTNIQQWANENFEQNTRHPEHLIYKSITGHFVRSKSETIIANSLFTNKIPYRYECALNFEDNIFFPDFTIIHPKTLKIFYWEHFGMMDIQSYCENTYNKLKIYGNHGIIPSINLITTFETRLHPIDSNKIQQIIEDFFIS